MTALRIVDRGGRLEIGAWRSLAALALAAGVAMLLALLPAAASAQPSASAFDHVSTAFPLRGAHEQVRCETCHVKGIFKGTPRECDGCHVAGNARGALAKPFNHLQTAQACDACHTVASFGGARFNHVGVSPGSCASCHNGVRAPGKSPGHFQTTLSCDQCHGTSAFLPVRRFDHQALNGNLSTCASCHDGRTATGLPSNHLPTLSPSPCATCHVASTQNGFASFAGGQMDHGATGAACASCHGPGIGPGTFAGITSIVTIPPTSPAGAGSHIPTTGACETCHLGSRPTGLGPANASRGAPGSGFATPVPTSAQIHTGVTGGCASCHETNATWMGMSAYPISPTVLTAGAQYRGFQTRPIAAATTFSVADAAHPASGDCSQCHAGTNFFSGEVKPANHIPTSSTATCSACHTSSDYSAMPTLANIHANAPSTTNNCAQCHGAAAPSFAIPAANFSIVGLPSNHLPTSASCEACHVGAGSSISATPVGNGARFANSRMSHAGITNNCAACHGPTITGSSFAGVGKIIVMPPTSPVGPSSHIPSSTVCESCHLGSTPSGLTPAVAPGGTPGSGFATPAPTSAQIHAGVSGNCSICHDTGALWMGVSAYPIAPTVVTSGAQYTGFHTRPVAAASTYSVADAAHPLTGDCSQCHAGTAYFSAQAKPPGHIPTQAACSTCHVTQGDFSVAGLTTNMATLHTGITSGCITCHTAGSGAGPFAGCATQANCASPPPLTYQPKTMPIAPGSSPTAPSAQTHVPAVGIACERCHSATVFTSFAGMNMKGNTPAHTAVASATCQSCHEVGYAWFGVTIRTPGSTSHHGRTPGEDCTSSGCHRPAYTQFSDGARFRPVLRSAVHAANPRPLPEGAQLPGQNESSGVLAFDHRGVLPGQCQTCHNGQAARGLPARHWATRTSCDACHRSTAWVPAQFNHQGVLPGQCQTCHNASQATGKSPGHFFTARSCDACHRTIGWVPASYSHLSPLYRAQPDKTTCTSCHVTNGEIIPRQLRAGPRPRPIPGPQP